MILVTHGVVGGALAKVFHLNPVTAFAVGFVSHFCLDALPHWDYPLRSGTKRRTENPLDGEIRIGKDFVFDLTKIIPDILAGIAIPLFFFSTFGSDGFSLKILLHNSIFWGAIGGIVPDFLQFAYFQLKRQPFIIIQKFHEFIHTEHRLAEENKSALGIILQILLILAAIIIAR